MTTTYPIMVIAILWTSSNSLFAQTFDLKYSADILADSWNYAGDLYDDGETKLFVRRANASIKQNKITLIDKHDKGWELSIGGKLSGKYTELDNSVSLKDAYILFDFNSYGSFKIGKQKEALGLEKQQSLTNSVFMERSLTTNSFTGGRKFGIAYKLKLSDFMIFASALEEPSDNPDYYDALLLSTRAYYSPSNTPSVFKFVHLGIGYSKRKPTDHYYDIDEAVIAPNSGNSFHSAQYFSPDISLENIELLVGIDKFVFQSEVFLQNLSESIGDNYSQSGYYLQFSYTPIGNSRTYKKGKLRLKNTIGKSLELGLRFSQTKSQNFQQGDNAKLWEIVANYFYEKDWRFSLQYGRSDIDRATSTLPVKVSGNSFGARAQWVF